MTQDIDEIRKEFFKKSVSVGHHNMKYNWMQIMLMILSCIRGRESFEEGAKYPSAQTLRDRLNLDGDWLEYFHICMWSFAEKIVRFLRRVTWLISVDETHIPFFGNRKALNRELVAKGFGEIVHGYRAKTPGATGSFTFLVVSLCCWRIRIPIAIKMVKVHEPYQPWLEPVLQRLLELVPQAKVLADRGFGKSTWFHSMLERLDANQIVRIPLRAKRLKKKVAQNQRRFQYWMTDSKTKEKVLLNVRVVKDAQGHVYLFATTEDKVNSEQLLAWYLQRWDLENIFKDSERVQLPTSSRNPTMRLFCVVLSFFCFTIWQISRFKCLQGPKPSLRRFVKHWIVRLCTLLHCYITPLGELVLEPP